MQRVFALGLLLFMQLAQQSLAESQDSNLRISVGRHMLTTDPANAYAGDQSKQHSGWSIAAEMPQSDHTASRAIFYRVADDRLTSTGLEMQILWGYGLATPGIRVYAGPGFFFEHRHDLLADEDQFDAFRDFALSAGLGYQYKRYVVDMNYQLRDPRSYERELKTRGVDDSVNASSMNLSFGYQF